MEITKVKELIKMTKKGSAIFRRELTEFCNSDVGINVPKAQYELGMCYYNGKGVVQDRNEAYRYFEMAKNRIEEFGDAYFKIGTSEENNKQTKFYLNVWKMTVLSGPDELYEQLEWDAIRNKDAEKVLKSVEKTKLKELKTAAEDGDVSSAYLLGDRYLRGDGVKRDVEKCIGFWSLIADKKPEIYADLGNLYLNGEGVTPDYNKAVKCFRTWERSVSHPSRYEPLFELGNCYFEGRGVDRDEKKARKYFDRALKVYLKNQKKCGESTVDFSKLGVKTVNFIKAVAKQGKLTDNQHFTSNISQP